MCVADELNPMTSAYFPPLILLVHFSDVSCGGTGKTNLGRGERRGWRGKAKAPLALSLK